MVAAGIGRKGLWADGDVEAWSKSAVVFALSGKMERPQAHEFVAQACRQATEQSRHLRDVLLESPQVRGHLSAEDLARLFDPKNYLGLSEALVDRALAAASENPPPEKK